MTKRILWFVDRFGINGSYRVIWLQLLAKHGIKPTDVDLVFLHKEMKGQLLTRLGSRKAPTWMPDRQEEIKAKMESIINHRKAVTGFVVITAPEALAALNLHPEHATLHKLRGSVYSLCGLPTLITLPMSVWNSIVSERDIAIANYGLESEEEMHAMAAAAVIPDSHETDDSESDAEDEDFGGGAMAVGDRDSSAEKEDQFYYVPVMTPVGQMVLNFDMAKLGRYIHGKQGAGFLPV